MILMGSRSIVIQGIALYLKIQIELVDNGGILFFNLQG
jgi:hypothetical protein